MMAYCCRECGEELGDGQDFCQEHPTATVDSVVVSSGQSRPSSQPVNTDDTKEPAWQSTYQ